MSAAAPDDEPPHASADDPFADTGGIAGTDVLHRVEIVAALYAVVAGAVVAAASGWRRGLALTAAGAVSIVALRSLEGVVRRLRAVAGEAAPSLGWRYPLRLFLLAGLVLLLLLGWHDGSTVVLGLVAVPLALLVEAAFQLLSHSRER
ncbi:MAG TPA: hypothetical protein VN923_20450 [Thermoanaerobaculia bacterium]|nr:hypothetical protein [Thermoanaerobaculia bacterium]